MKKNFKTVLILAAVLLVTAGCELTGAQPEPTAAPSQPAATQGMPTPPPTTAPTVLSQPDPIQVFFTSPAGEANEDGALETALLADLDAAANSIDIAMYNFSLKRVEEALAQAAARGVAVRYVTDSDDIDDPPLRRLKQAGIKIIGDRRESTMHNKFLVIDGVIVWTGSLNLTGSGAYTDNNNFARFASPAMAENYTTEFEEMFLKDGFSSDGVANTPNPSFQIGSVKLQNYFSPEDKIARHLASLLKGAQSSIDVLAYSFTSDTLADAILERANDGVSVRGVFETEQYRSNTGGEFDNFKKAGLEVRLDGNQGLMHHKILIVDRRVVIFGSYNYSNNAERKNDENVVVIDDPRLAALFENEFERIYGQAAP